MAQRTNVVLVDDLDGTDASETVSFSLDGVDYQIELNSAHAAELRDALAVYVGHARRETGRRRRATSRSSAAANGPTAAEIRAWARDNGHDVPDRGRVPAAVREAYLSAH
ncbi:MAG TPA: Lsr2 family protein [Nocardioidaceae bacterium]|nr:Lsr2 family protein [Nocardioidaceae bacterium]